MQKRPLGCSQPPSWVGDVSWRMGCLVPPSEVLWPNCLSFVAVLRFIVGITIWNSTELLKVMGQREGRGKEG